MPTTPNYNLPYPALADPPDAPAAFQALAEATDTALGGLTPDAIAETLLNAKGDLVVASAADTAARLAVGTAGQVLTADSAAPTGVKWATPAAAVGSRSTVATNEATTSTAYSDLATNGPSVTVSVGASGIAIVSISAEMSRSSADSFWVGLMSFEVSGANTRSPADSDAASVGQVASTGSNGDLQLTSGVSVVLTGLTPGSTTFTAKYRGSNSVGAVFSKRQIGVVTF